MRLQIYEEGRCGLIHHADRLYNDNCVNYEMNYKISTRCNNEIRNASHILYCLTCRLLKSQN